MPPAKTPQKPAAPAKPAAKPAAKPTPAPQATKATKANETPARGAVRPTTADEAVARALSMICVVPVPPAGSPSDGGNRPGAYRLKEMNGGKDPYAPHCFDWSYGQRTPTADCVGFVLWASGLDRLQPDYAGSAGPWLHCPSIIDDADGKKVWCAPVEYKLARPGDWLVTAGHIGLVVRGPQYLPNGKMTSDILVVDCSPRHAVVNETGEEDACAVNTGYPWSKACRVVRYTRYAAKK